MNIQTKIVILLTVTLSVLIGAVVGYQLINLQQKKIFLQSTTDNYNLVIDQVVSTKSEKYLMVAKDNSGWDDMVAFCTEKDSAWATDNINYMIETFNLDFVNIYDTLYNPYYSVYDSSASINNIDLKPAEIHELFKQNAYCHFFIYKNTELYEIYGSTIVPSADIELRKTKPKGYLFVARHWDKEFVAELQTATTFQIFIEIYNLPENQKKENYIINSRTLKNYKNEDFLKIYFIAYNNINKDLESFILLSVIITIITGLTIFIFIFFFRRWITKPLKNISQVLRTDNKDLLHFLVHRKDEFGQISKLITDFFVQRDNLQESNLKIMKQKEVIEHNHLEITNNINYAKRIQNAILPAKDDLELYFPNHFIFYNPRDIVSGDFYWTKRINNTIVFVAADCTGHGVSGAFMSIMGIAFLNEIVTKLMQLRRKTIYSYEVLNMMRELIMKALRQTGTSAVTKDGMDAAVCIFDMETYEMQYSGANAPVIIIQNNEITELEPDKMPLGIHPKAINTFSNQTVQLNENAMVYLYSDGFADQFGGDKNRKLTRQGFKDFLYEIYKLPLTEQSENVHSKFFAWKKNYEQTDDVMVIGLQISFDKKLIAKNQVYNWNGFTFLIVEDSELNFAILKNYLTKTEANIIWAKNGQEGVDILKNDNNINVVLMDLQMPVMNGYEAIVNIRTFNKKIPVIVQTAFNLSDEKERSFKAGCNDYIQKPYSENEILATISKYLEM